MSKMKRLSSPRFWPIQRKSHKYVISLTPGPHSLKNSMPLGVFIRDILKYAETLKEVKILLNQGIVKVDNVVRKSYRFPVGFMDVVSIGEENYRVSADKKGLVFKEIDAKEANTKLLRIRNKHSIRGGRTQLNFHDGTNTIVEDGKKYNTNDVLILDINKKSIEKILPFRKGSTAIIIEGSNKGQTGKIEKVVKVRSSQKNRVTISLEKRKISIPHDYIFVLGEDKPAIGV